MPVGNHSRVATPAGGRQGRPACVSARRPTTPPRHADRIPANCDTPARIAGNRHHRPASVPYEAPPGASDRRSGVAHRGAWVNGVGHQGPGSGSRAPALHIRQSPERCATAMTPASPERLLRLPEAGADYLNVSLRILRRHWPRPGPYVAPSSAVFDVRVPRFSVIQSRAERAE